jgi:transcription elongation factor Elf1
MYTQELICPSCGDIATVNVLTSTERKNPQSSSCHNCNQKIYYDVDSQGEIMDIREPTIIPEEKKPGVRREPRW